MKINILIILLLLPTVAAAPTTINILNIEVNDGELEIVDRIKTIGYHPSYKSQPTDGYTLRTTGDGRNLFTVKFNLPVEYLDGHEGDVNVGGVQGITSFAIFNERESDANLGGVQGVTSFAMTIPSFQQEEKIEIFDKENKRVDQYSLKEEGNTLLFSLIGIFIVLLIFAGFYIKSRIAPQSLS